MIITIAGFAETRGTITSIARQNGQLILRFVNEKGVEGVYALDALPEGTEVTFREEAPLAPVQSPEQVSAPVLAPVPNTGPAPALFRTYSEEVRGDTMVHLYTDGSCSGNPGPAGAGWCAVLKDQVVLEGNKPLGHATNQVAEILAAAMGLEALPAGSIVTVMTDSQYVVNTMTMGWRRKANGEHWARLDAAVARHGSVAFGHVKGHNGDRWNERVDGLATRATAAN